MKTIFSSLKPKTSAPKPKATQSGCTSCGSKITQKTKSK